MEYGLRDVVPAFTDHYDMMQQALERANRGRYGVIPLFPIRAILGIYLGYLHSKVCRLPHRLRKSKNKK